MAICLAGVAFCLRASAALFLNIHKINRLYHGTRFAKMSSYHLGENIIDTSKIKAVAKTKGIRGRNMYMPRKIEQSLSKYKYE